MERRQGRSILSLDNFCTVISWQTFNLWSLYCVLRNFRSLIVFCINLRSRGNIRNFIVKKNFLCRIISGIWIVVTFKITVVIMNLTIIVVIIAMVVIPIVIISEIIILLMVVIAIIISEIIITVLLILFRLWILFNVCSFCNNFVINLCFDSGSGIIFCYYCCCLNRSFLNLIFLLFGFRFFTSASFRSGFCLKFLIDMLL